MVKIYENLMVEKLWHNNEFWQKSKINSNFCDKFQVFQVLWNFENFFKSVSPSSEAPVAVG